MNVRFVRPTFAFAVSYLFLASLQAAEMLKPVIPEGAKAIVVYDKGNRKAIKVGWLPADAWVRLIDDDGGQWDRVEYKYTPATEECRTPVVRTDFDCTKQGIGWVHKSDVKAIPLTQGTVVNLDCNRPECQGQKSTGMFDSILNVFKANESKIPPLPVTLPKTPPPPVGCESTPKPAADGYCKDKINRFSSDNVELTFQWEAECEKTKIPLKDEKGNVLKSPNGMPRFKMGLAQEWYCVMRLPQGCRGPANKPRDPMEQAIDIANFFSKNLQKKSSDYKFHQSECKKAVSLYLENCSDWKSFTPEQRIEKVKNISSKTISGLKGQKGEALNGEVTKELLQCIAKRESETLDPFDLNYTVCQERVDPDDIGNEARKALHKRVGSGMTNWVSDAFGLLGQRGWVLVEHWDRYLSKEKPLSKNPQNKTFEEIYGEPANLFKALYTNYDLQIEIMARHLNYLATNIRRMNPKYADMYWDKVKNTIPFPKSKKVKGQFVEINKDNPKAGKTFEEIYGSSEKLVNLLNTNSIDGNDETLKLLNKELARFRKNKNDPAPQLRQVYTSMIYSYDTDHSNSYVSGVKACADCLDNGLGSTQKCLEKVR